MKKQIKILNVILIIISILNCILGNYYWGYTNVAIAFVLLCALHRKAKYKVANHPLYQLFGNGWFFVNEMIVLVFLLFYHKNLWKEKYYYEFTYGVFAGITVFIYIVFLGIQNLKKANIDKNKRM